MQDVIYSDRLLRKMEKLLLALLILVVNYSAERNLGQSPDFAQSIMIRWFQSLTSLECNILPQFM